MVVCPVFARLWRCLSLLRALPTAYPSRISCAMWCAIYAWLRRERHSAWSRYSGRGSPWRGSSGLKRATTGFCGPNHLASPARFARTKAATTRRSGKDRLLEEKEKKNGRKRERSLFSRGFDEISGVRAERAIIEPGVAAIFIRRIYCSKEDREGEKVRALLIWTLLRARNRLISMFFKRLLNFFLTEFFYMFYTKLFLLLKITE